MSIIDEKTRQFAANSLLPSFFYAALGLIFSQVGVAQMDGFWGLHIFLGMPGATLVGLALFRARLHWNVADVQIPSRHAHALNYYMPLLVAGFFIGAVMAMGAVGLIGVVTTLTYLLPWTKIPMHRTRFAMSAVAALAGVVAWIFILVRPAQPFYFLLAAWMLYAAPIGMHVLVMVSLDRGYRIGDRGLTGKPNVDGHVPLAQ